MPAQPQNTKQPTRDRCRLGDDRPIYLDVINNVLDILARGLPAGELQPQHEQRRVVGCSWDGETYNEGAGRWKAEDLARSLGEGYSSIRAVPQRHRGEAISGDINREADGHVLKQTRRREKGDVKISGVIQRAPAETERNSIRVGVTRRNI